MSDSAGWAQFYASVIGLVVAIGVPSVLHLMDRAERRSDKKDARNATAAQRASARKVAGTHIVVMLWDCYVRAGNLRSMMLGFSVNNTAPERIPVEDAERLTGLWSGWQFSTTLATGVFIQAVVEIDMADASLAMFQVERSMRNFDIMQRQFAELARSGQLKYSTVARHLAAQHGRLEVIRSASEKAIRAIDHSIPGVRSFEEIVESATADKEHHDEVEQGLRDGTYGLLASEDSR